MATQVDEFSFDHPQNQGHGKWRRLRLLKTEDDHYSTISRKFYRGWKHPNKRKPQIHAIFKILYPDSSLKPFHRYRAYVLTSPALRGKVKNPVNEQLLFHGTNRSCKLAEDTSRILLCGLMDCNLCSVIRNSFDIKRCGSKNKFKRFGTGIYTTSCSSKADDYTYNADDSAKLRVMVVSRVVVGNPLTRRKNATSLTEPPEGYHSVIGEPGIDLNYEETVVYDNDAIRPAFLIVYGDMPAQSKTRIQAVIANLFKTPVVS